MKSKRAKAVSICFTFALSFSVAKTKSITPVEFINQLLDFDDRREPNHCLHVETVKEFQEFKTEMEALGFIFSNVTKTVATRGAYA